MRSEEARQIFKRRQLLEVICQLRFPDILKIESTDPAEFQDRIRGEYPQYQKKVEQLPPQIVNGKPVPQGTVNNYQFISEDSQWKVSLTKSFVALSTHGYLRWEEFAKRLDRVLAALIQLYQPAFFERIGLRYVNAVSRKALGLEDVPWVSLIQPAFLGVLAELDVDEQAASRSSVDAHLALPEGQRLKLHAGPGLLGGGKKDPEIKFILDGDFSVAGSLSADRVPAVLEGLHGHAVRLFRGAVTSDLHTAMGPEPL